LAQKAEGIQGYHRTESSFYKRIITKQNSGDAAISYFDKIGKGNFLILFKIMQSREGRKFKFGESARNYSKKGKQNFP